MAGRRRDLAQPDHRFAQRRLGLRRSRLRGRRPGTGHAGRRRPPDHRSWARGLRVLMDLVPNHTSEEHPWFVDPGRRARRVIAGGTSGPTPRMTDRLPTTGCPASGARPGPSTRAPASTTCTTISSAARPQLVGRRGPGHLRRHPGLLARPGRGRVPHRRVQHDHQGRAAAGQPAGHRGGHLRGAALRPAVGVQRQPARGPRGASGTGGAGRRVPGQCAGGETPVERWRHWPATTATGGDELHMAFNFPFISSPLEARGHAPHRRGRRARPARRGLAGVDGIEPRHVPVRHPVGRGRPAKARVCTAHAPLPPGHAGPLPGRRDRTGRHRRAPRADAGPARRPVLAGLCGRDAMRTPMQWRDGPGGGFTAPGVQPWLPFGDLDGVQRRCPAGRSRLDAGPDPRPDRPATGDARTPGRRLPVRRLRPPGRGPGAGATGWW